MYTHTHTYTGFSGGSAEKNLPTVQEMQVRSLGWEDPLEKETAAHSSILAWRIPWTEEPGKLVHGVARSWTWLKRLRTDTHTYIYRADQKNSIHEILGFKKNSQYCRKFKRY